MLEAVAFTKLFALILAVASKAPRKNFNAGGSSASSSSGGEAFNSSFSAVNHAKMWPTPKWQKGWFSIEYFIL